MRFTNRTQAGEALVSRIESTHTRAQLVVGLARGGVAVAHPVAAAIDIPLEVLVVKKIPSPDNTELAIGALAPDDVSVVYWRHAHRVGADEQYVKTKTAELREDIKQKMLLYRKGKPPVEVRGKEVIIIDDGAATGATLEAAIAWLRAKKVRKISVALPVAPPDVVARIAPEVADIVVLHAPQSMGSVGEYYEDFAQVTDHEVVELLI